ncbi:hypothetical protein [Consotaella salsifontis]|uniref:Uncharacterized protein n=1 Tax=Consotaella salsifontis TaxID=1365950 RepID=A0A1T4SEA4_9HYPH|nr:hypothetical protein [Consotaella salsifontis]SKA26466.1 hypothetical protein SAMN05428963_11082 [Consotaella salsifontis]
MNEGNDTTPAEEAASEVTFKALIEAVHHLETPLSNAKSAANVLSLLVENNMDHVDLLGGSRVVILNESTAEAITWSVYHSEQLVKDFYACWDRVNDLAFALRRAVR